MVMKLQLSQNAWHFLTNSGLTEGLRSTELGVSMYQAEVFLYMPLFNPTLQRDMPPRFPLNADIYLPEQIQLHNANLRFIKPCIR